MSRVIRYPRRVFVLLALALWAVTGSLTAHGQDDPQTILWAGIAYRGNVADTNELLPITKLVVDEVGLLRLNKLAWEGVQQVKRDDIRFSQALGESTSGDAIALALALDFEQFNERVVADAVCVTGRLWAQILVFDFSEKKLIGAFPIQSVPKNVCERNTRNFPEAKKVSMTQQLLYKDTSNSILARFTERLEHQKFHAGWQANIKVTQVTLGPKTKEVLDTVGWSHNSYRRWLAAGFAASMSDQQQIPVLPYSLGGAIAGAMPLRFSDTDAFDMALPPEDYAIQLTARGYATKVLKEFRGKTRDGEPGQLVGSTIAHIFGLGVTFVDASFDEELMSENLQVYNLPKEDANGRRMYSANDEVDDRNIFERITIVLVSDFLSQFPTPDKAWVSKHVKSDTKWKALQKSFMTVDKEIFANIRGD